MAAQGKRTNERTNECASETKYRGEQKEAAEEENAIECGFTKQKQKQIIYLFVSIYTCVPSISAISSFFVLFHVGFFRSRLSFDSS